MPLLCRDHSGASLRSTHAPLAPVDAPTARRRYRKRRRTCFLAQADELAAALREDKARLEGELELERARSAAAVASASGSADQVRPSQCESHFLSWHMVSFGERADGLGWYHSLLSGCRAAACAVVGYAGQGKGLTPGACRMGVGPAG